MAPTRRSTTIGISTTTRDALKELGIEAESYDQIAARLVARARYEAFYDKQLRILQTEDFVPLDEI